jgi:hypothetical protein
MSIAKQLAMNFSVNGTPFPMEVIDIIKSFAFEDRVVKFIKNKKRDIVKIVDDAIYSRKNLSRREPRFPFKPS